MGINVLSNASSQEVSIPSGTAITSGDLVVNTEAGPAYPASTALSVAQNNNTTAGASAISAIATITGSNYGATSTAAFPCMAQLTNGTVVFAYSGNGTTYTTGINVVFKNMNGGNPVATVVPTSATNSYTPIVRALPNGGVVVAWISSAGAFSYAIYTSAGAVTKAATTIATSVSSPQNIGYYTMNVLTGGNIVFAYNKSNAMAYQIIDSSGNAVLAETTIEAASTPVDICIRPLSAGGFVISYFLLSGLHQKVLHT